MSAALQPITAPSCCRSAQIDPLHKPKTTPIFQKLPALRESAVLTGNSELISRYCEKCGLEFHPTTESILRYLSPEIEIERIGVSANWRKDLRIMFRVEGSSPPAHSTWRDPVTELRA